MFPAVVSEAALPLIGLVFVFQEDSGAFVLALVGGVILAAIWIYVRVRRSGRRHRGRRDSNIGPAASGDYHHYDHDSDGGGWFDGGGGGDAGGGGGAAGGN